MAQTSKTTVSFYLNGKYEKMSQETREKIEKLFMKQITNRALLRVA